MIKITLLALNLFIVSSCYKMNFNSFGFKPSSMKMKLEENEGSTEFRRGYADGCESGYSGYANSFNKLFYTWKQDPILANKKGSPYYQIWKDAYAYCANYGNMIDAHTLGNWR